MRPELTENEPLPDPTLITTGIGRLAGTPRGWTAAFEQRRRIRGVDNAANQSGGWAVRLAVFWIVLISVLAILAPVLPMPDPNDIDLRARSAGPNGSHWLGTDPLGRDVLSRLVFGGRVSLVMGIGTVGLAAVVGGFLGLLAGYLRGWVDRVVTMLSNIVLAFPGLILAMALTAFLGLGLRNLVIAVGVTATPLFVRVARSTSLQISSEEYVLAARVMGAKRWRTLVSEVLPNAWLPLATISLLFVGVAMIVEGALSFLGLGVPPPTSSWGSMIAAGRDDIANEPRLVLLPAIALFFTILSFNMIGESVRRRFNVRAANL